MTGPVTIRVPDAWHGLDSDHLTRWLEDYLACPYPLPDDPGAGQARVCLSLPGKLVQKLQRRCVAQSQRRFEGSQRPIQGTWFPVPLHMPSKSFPRPPLSLWSVFRGQVRGKIRAFPFPGGILMVSSM